MTMTIAEIVERLEEIVSAGNDPNYSWVELEVRNLLEEIKTEAIQASNIERVRGNGRGSRVHAVAREETRRVRGHTANLVSGRMEVVWRDSPGKVTECGYWFDSTWDSHTVVNKAVTCAICLKVLKKSGRANPV